MRAARLMSAGVSRNPRLVMTNAAPSTVIALPTSERMTRSAPSRRHQIGRCTESIEDARAQPPTMNGSRRKPITIIVARRQCSCNSCTR